MSALLVGTGPMWRLTAATIGPTHDWRETLHESGGRRLTVYGHWSCRKCGGTAYTRSVREYPCAIGCGAGWSGWTPDT